MRVQKTHEPVTPVMTRKASDYSMEEPVAGANGGSLRRGLEPLRSLVRICKSLRAKIGWFVLDDAFLVGAPGWLPGSSPR
jgi:hypothetical protein